MTAAPSDALVFFGATGDLAYKQIFPALQGLVRDEGIDVPIVGVAKSGWKLEQFRARARDSLDHHGSFDEAAFARLLELLNYVDGDYNDPRTFQQVKQALGSAAAAAALSGDPALAVRRRRVGARRGGLEPERPSRGREAVRPRPGVGAGAQQDAARAFSRRARSSASTIISARSRSRTSSTRASPTRPSSRCGTATTSAASRSPWRNPSAWTTAAPSTTRQARCATSFRTTCCRSSRI